jgi:hypothetical protein
MNHDFINYSYSTLKRWLSCQKYKRIRLNTAALNTTIDVLLLLRVVTVVPLCRGCVVMKNILSGVLCYEKYFMSSIRFYLYVQYHIVIVLNPIYSLLMLAADELPL